LFFCLFLLHLWSSCPNDGTFVVFLSQRWHICGLLVPTMAHLWSSCPNDGTFVVFLSQRWHICGLLGGKIDTPNIHDLLFSWFGTNTTNLRWDKKTTNVPSLGQEDHKCAIVGTRRPQMFHRWDKKTTNVPMAHLWSSCPNDGTFVVVLSQRWYICGLLVPTMAHLWSSCPNDGIFMVFLSQRWNIFGLLVPTQVCRICTKPVPSLGQEDHKCAIVGTRRPQMCHRWDKKTTNVPSLGQDDHKCAIVVYLFCLCFYDLPLGFWNWFYALSFIF
jgi:hypothetical protein